MILRILKALFVLFALTAATNAFSQCNMCSTPAAPAEYGGIFTANYYKGSVIQLWAKSQSVCERDWYKVVGTDTTSLGTGDTLSAVTDTTCKYIARNKNTCISTGVNYYSSYVVMANITVVTGTSPTYTIGMSPVICSGTPTDILLLTGTSGAIFSYLRNDTPSVTGALSGTSYAGPLSVTLTNTTGTNQAVRFVIHMRASGNYYTGDQIVYVTVLPSSAPSGNHCYAPSIPHSFINSNSASLFNIYKGATTQLLADSTIAADSVQWYKVVGPDTSYFGSGYSIGVTADTSCLFLARNVNTCNCSSGSNYYSAWSRMDSLTIYTGYTPVSFRVANDMPIIASGTQIDLVPDLDSSVFKNFFLYLDNANVTGTKYKPFSLSVNTFDNVQLTNTTTSPQLVRYWLSTQTTATGSPLGNSVSGYITVLPSTSTAPANNH